MEKISFIIPAYRAEKTIERTVDSIRDLDIDLEIIIVENGHGDETSSILSDISAKYDDVHVFSSEKGVSIARNKGIEQATGKWIVFSDADDVSLKGLEKLAEFIDTYDTGSSEIDLIMGSYMKDDDPVIHDYTKLNTVIVCDDGIKTWMLSKPTRSMQAWAKIYRTDFLRDNKLLFNESLSYSEDSEFVLRVLQKAGKMIISDTPIYQYRTGTPSVMRGFVDGRINAYIKALEVAERDIDEESPLVKKAFVDYVSAHVNIIGVHDIFSCDIKEPWRERCKKMRQCLQEGVIQRAVDKVSLSTGISNLPVLLCKYHLTFLGGLIYYIRSLQNKKRYGKAAS